jgi:hypothetical protein
VTILRTILSVEFSRKIPTKFRGKIHEEGNFRGKNVRQIDSKGPRYVVITNLADVSSSEKFVGKKYRECSRNKFLNCYQRFSHYLLTTLQPFYDFVLLN